MNRTNSNFYRARREAASSLWREDANGLVHIPLMHGQEAVIDKVDREECSQFNWMAEEDDNTWYVCALAPRYLQAKYGTRRIKLHSLIMKPPAGFEVDHRDHDGLNCSRSNLRIATRGQNQANRIFKKKSKSGFRGVSRFGRRWKAGIEVNYKFHYLGMHSTPEEAAMAYNGGALLHVGEFAVLNVIPATSQSVSDWT